MAVPRQESGEGEEAEEIEAREQWFLFERRYPFDSIPENARQRAWESRPKARLTTPAAQMWNPIGPNPTMSAFPGNWGVTSGRINTIAISPTDPQLVLIGSATGGIWRSSDGGAKFVPVSDDQVDLAVGSIVFAPSNASIVYAGMGDMPGRYLGSGVLKSTDSGQSWKRVSNDTLPTPGTIAKVEVDPTNPNRVYVAQFSYTQASANSTFSSGFHLSTDGGVGWKKTLSGLAVDLVVNSRTPQTLYLAMSRVDEPGGTLGPGLYKSTDGGATWVNSYPLPYTTASNVKVAVSPDNPLKIYVYAGGSTGPANDFRLAVSPDGGQTWTSRSVAGLVDTAQFTYNNYIYADPQNSSTIYLGTRDVFKSTDGGVAWINLTNNFRLSGTYDPFASASHPDQHAFTFSPFNSQEILIGNDGGISKSSDGGNTFFSVNQSLSLTQFTSLALHPTDPMIAYGGTQDNGTQRRLRGPRQWEEFSSGDGGSCVINPLDPSIVFITYVFGSITRFRDNGDRFDRPVGSNSIFGESDGGPRIAFYAPLVGNAVDDTLYFGTWRLFVSHNLGDSWSLAGVLDLTKGITSSGADVLNAIGVSPSNPNVIYTGSRQGQTMMTPDGGQNWTTITAGLPNRTIKSITVSRKNPAVAYLTVSGFGSGHVFKTVNSGLAWTDISGNLPNIPTNALLSDPTNDKMLYVGTDIGVFRSTTDGTAWETFNNGLPPIIVTAFGAQSGGVIQLATYGRGAYELKGTSGDITPPTVTVLSPNGGESIPSGSALSITWTSSDDTAVTAQSVDLSLDSGATFGVPVASGLAGNVTSFNFNIPVTLGSTTARVRVTAKDAAGNTGSDASDADFRITSPIKDTTPPTVHVTAPNGGENVTAGGALSVTWTATDDTGVVTQNLELSTDGGATFAVPLAVGLTGNVFSFAAALPATVATGRARVRVLAKDAAGNTGSDASDADFTISALESTPPSVKVLAPNGGEKLKAGSTFRLTWQSSDNVGVVSHEIFFSTDGGATFPTRIATGLPGSAQSFDFAVPVTQPKTKTARVRVVAQDAAGNEGRDDSDGNFQIKPHK